MKPGDRIAVCISGERFYATGETFQELKRHNKFDFEVKFLCDGSRVQSGQSSGDRRECETSEIPIEILSQIF